VEVNSFQVLAIGFMGLWCVVPFSVQEKMGLLVWRDHLMFLLCLPSFAHLSASSCKGYPQWAFILMKMVSRPCSLRTRRSCTIYLMMSVSGFLHREGVYLPIHFWEEVRKHAESERRIAVFCPSSP